MEDQMMSTLDMGKSVDDIEAPVLLPEGWYECEIVVPAPMVMPNRAKADDPGSPEAGDNWVVHLKTIHEEPMYNGRRLTIWLPIPKPQDEETYTQRGQRVSDAKVERIANFVESFEGNLMGSNVAVGVGGKGMAYVQQTLNRQSNEPENQVDPFGKFKAVESESPF